MDRRMLPVGVAAGGRVRVGAEAWLDSKGVRDRAFALHAALEDALAADRTLGGIADYASVTRIEIDEGYDEGSVMCGIRTTVAVDTTVA